MWVDLGDIVVNLGDVFFAEHVGPEVYNLYLTGYANPILIGRCEYITLKAALLKQNEDATFKREMELTMAELKGKDAAIQEANSRGSVPFSYPKYV